MGGDSFVVAYFGADGTFLWNKAFPIPQSSQGNGAGPRVAFGPHGELIVAGSYFRTIDLGGGELPMTAVTAGDSNVFIAAWDASGKLLWSKGYGSPQQNTATNIAADGMGNVYVLGQFSSAIDFGGGPLTTTPPDSSQGGTQFLVKFAVH